MDADYNFGHFYRIDMKQQTNSKKWRLKFYFTNLSFDHFVVVVAADAAVAAAVGLVDSENDGELKTGMRPKTWVTTTGSGP